MNPTNVSYEFNWEAIGTPNPCFRCGSTAGIILGGKRQEMVFEFTPATVEPTEAYYRFSIPSQSITAVFLIAGVVVEPKVRIMMSSGCVLHPVDTHIPTPLPSLPPRERSNALFAQCFITVSFFPSHALPP